MEVEGVTNNGSYLPLWPNSLALRELPQLSSPRCTFSLLFVTKLVPSRGSLCVGFLCRVALGSRLELSRWLQHLGHCFAFVLAPFVQRQTARHQSCGDLAGRPKSPRESPSELPAALQKWRGCKQWRSRAPLARVLAALGRLPRFPASSIRSLSLDCWSELFIQLSVVSQE